MPGHLCSYFVYANLEVFCETGSSEISLFAHVVQGPIMETVPPNGIL